MSMDLAAIRTAIVNGLSGSGISTYESISGAQSLPFAVLGNPESITYTRDLGGSAEIRMPLWVMVDRTDDASAQRALDGYVSTGTASSIFNKLKGITPTAWKSLGVLSTGPYGSTEVNSAKALAVAINLTINA